MSKRSFFCALIFPLLFFSCVQPQTVDLILYNGRVITFDSTSRAEAIAIKDGKIVAVGTNADILKHYTATEKIQVAENYIYPGFYDAHSHFLGLGQYAFRVDLRGSGSFDEVVTRCISFRQSHNDEPWLLGRGWDQNLWAGKKFPTREKLDAAFPDVPVMLSRVDGHAVLVNGKALELAGITEKTKIAGGEIEIVNGKVTGVLIDNAVELVEKVIPKPTTAQLVKYLKKAEEICLANGLTTVTDAGLDYTSVLLIDSLQKAGELHLPLYVMLNADERNIGWLKSRGMIRTNTLHVRSFKMYGDGSLGSRGACLLQDYQDKPGWRGFLLNDPGKLKKTAGEIAAAGFQMNVHCIGDSAQRFMLGVFEEVLAKDKDRRWRIEHAQVIAPEDIGRYGMHNNILPSMQPTHATSDMPWALDRIGETRLANAYALRKLKEQSGMIALGTDFPVEKVDPLATFYAAVYRKRKSEKASHPALFANALSPEDALKGMTIWAAFSCFEEKEKGSIEKGKQANFTILTQPLTGDAPKVFMTIIDGKLRYNSEKQK